MNRNQIGWAVAAGFIVWFATCWAAQAQDCGKTTQRSTGVYTTTCVHAVGHEVRFSYWACTSANAKKADHCIVQVTDSQGNKLHTVTTVRGRRVR